MIAESPAVTATAGLGVRFGAVTILRDVDVTIGAGSQHCVTGRSGSGKTTLLLALAGLVAPSAGAVTWPGLDPDPRVRRGQIGMVFQAPSLMPELTAVENVMLPLRLRGVDAARAGVEARRALDVIDAADLARALPAQLSGGQQQRVAIARALAGDHRLVLADEPTGSLDRDHARTAVDALRRWVAADGGSLVLATHDPEIAALFDGELRVVNGSIEQRTAAS